MWQSLLRNYLMGQAQQQMRSAAMKAAGEAMQAEPEAPQPREPEVCHVGLVFAMPIEAGGFVDKLSGMIKTSGAGFVAREGGLGGKRMLVFEGGAGRENAARATEALILGHRPRWVISAGFAGGLDEQVKRGDMLLANGLVEPSGRQLALDFKMPPAPRVHVGRLLTVDRVIRDPEEKLALGRQHQALAVDMETWAVAEICSREKVRFLSVRVILDDVNRALPRDIDTMVNKKTTAGLLGAAAGAIIRRPSSVKDMWQLKEDALTASDRLAKFLVGVIGQLPTEDRSQKDGSEGRSQKDEG